jgi:hypothetical protein
MSTERGLFSFRLDVPQLDGTLVASASQGLPIAAERYRADAEGRVLEERDGFKADAEGRVLEELPLDLVMREDWFLAHVDPHVSSQEANAPVLRKLLRLSPATERFQVHHPGRHLHLFVFVDHGEHHCPFPPVLARTTGRHRNTTPTAGKRQPRRCSVQRLPPALPLLRSGVRRETPSPISVAPRNGQSGLPTTRQPIGESLL